MSRPAGGPRDLTDPEAHILDLETRGRVDRGIDDGRPAFYRALADGDGDRHRCRRGGPPAPPDWGSAAPGAMGRRPNSVRSVYSPSAVRSILAHDFSTRSAVDGHRGPATCSRVRPSPDAPRSGAGRLPSATARSTSDAVPRAVTASGSRASFTSRSPLTRPLTRPRTGTYGWTGPGPRRSGRPAGPRRGSGRRGSADPGR